MAGAPGGARRPGGAPGRSTPRRVAGVLRGTHALGDRATHGPTARHGEDAAADRARQTGGGVEARERLDAMTDWLGMTPNPRDPRPELRARVLARAVRPGTRRRRWVW